ncbi:hypothetical protein Q1695_002581 [Nippostrongylus brasiliensis]|nr:hypothetical protein Q1695_002581 [Nippostrongylus brasiliensis]
MSSPCHILIALTCSMDLLHEFGHFPYAYHYFGMTTIVQSDCFWIQILPFIGACAGSPLILVLGVDRFIAVCFPSRLVQCSIPQAFGPSAFALVNHVGFGIHIANVMIYMISFFVLRRSGASTKKKRAFKSIFITVSIMICGWIVTFLVNTLSVYITKDLYVRGLLNMYAGISINIGLMSNVFVFYTIK